jgi:hypothetical protein
MKTVLLAEQLYLTQEGGEKTMTYDKPEVSVLGDASSLIQGGKHGVMEGDQEISSDAELDD